MNKHILALFKDPADEFIWTPVVDTAEPTIRIIVGENILLSLRNLQQKGIYPAVTILSGRLYPAGNPEIVSQVKQLFPETEFVVISLATDPPLPLQPLLHDNVRNLVINPDQHDFQQQNTRTVFRSAVSHVANRQPWLISDHVKQGTHVYEFSVASSDQKEELIQRLETLVSGDSMAMEMLRHKGALLADELLENAMYGAPRSPEGGKIYEKGQRREVMPGEQITFKLAFDGETLALEVVDGWGTLCPETIMEHLAVNQEEEPLMDTGGRGFFIIWRFLDHFHVAIAPGRQTVVGGHVRLDSNDDLSAPKGFTITLCN